MAHRIKDAVKIDRSFCVFVTPDGDDGRWIAHVVGPELDNLTEGSDPVDAVEMAADLIRILSGRCKDDHPHDFSEVGTLDPVDAIAHAATGEAGADEVFDLHNPVVPCRVCVRCGEKAVESEIEEI